MEEAADGREKRAKFVFEMMLICKYSSSIRNINSSSIRNINPHMRAELALYSTGKHVFDTNMLGNRYIDILVYIYNIMMMCMIETGMFGSYGGMHL